MSNHVGRGLFLNEPGVRVLIVKHKRRAGAIKKITTLIFYRRKFLVRVLYVRHFYTHKWINYNNFLLLNLNPGLKYRYEYFISRKNWCSRGISNVLHGCLIYHSRVFSNKVLSDKKIWLVL